MGLFTPYARIFLQIDFILLIWTLEIRPKLTIKKPDQRQWRRSGIFTVNFEHISHLFCSAFIVDFEQVSVEVVLKDANFVT